MSKSIARLVNEQPGREDILGKKQGRWACFRHLSWIGQQKIVLCDYVTWNAGTNQFGENRPIIGEPLIIRL